MSSIIRWRKAETLRTVGMGYPNDVVLLMASNGIGKLHRKTGWSSFPHTIKNGCAERLRATEFPRSGLVQRIKCCRQHLIQTTTTSQNSLRLLPSYA